MAANRASASTNLYRDTFESYTNGTPLVDGTNSWYASSINAIVQTNNAAPGSTKAAMLPIDTTLSNRFQKSSPTNTWLHLEVKSARYNGTNYPVADTNGTALFYLNSNGYLVAYNGSASTWVTITQTVYGLPAPIVASNTWTNIDVFMDYSNKTWQIALGVDLLPNNLGFASTTNSNINGFDTYNGNNTTTYLDNVYIYDQARSAAYEVRPKAFTNWFMQWYASTQTFDIVVMDEAATPSFTITTNAPYKPWIDVTPGAGTLTNGTNTITVNFSTNGLDTGAHTAILDVVTAFGVGITDQVTVVVASVSQPSPAASWTTYPQTIQKGAQPAMTNLLLSNNAAAPRSGMRYDVTSTSAWLLATTNGVCTNGEDHAITVQFINMTTNVGSYDGTLTIQTVDTNTTTVYTPVGKISSTLYVNVQLLIIGPGTPSGLTASDGTDAGGVQLNWQATTNVNHYEVWRATTNNIASATILASNVTGVTYYDTAINPGIKRWYWIRVINDFGGDGVFSVSDVGWRLLPAPTGLTATSGTYTNRVALSWTGSSGAVTYEIWRSIYTNIGLASNLVTLSSAITSYDDIPPNAILTYYYWVRSCTPDMGSYSDLASGYRAALLKPSNISASKGTFNSKVRVLWQSVEAAAKYEIWRSTDTNVANAVQIGTVTIRGYDDTQANISQIYYYWIKALDAQGFASPYSEMDTGWLQLATPANVAATQGTRPYSVRISWNPVENATSYEVVRSSSPVTAAVVQSLAGSTPLADGAGILSLSESTTTFFDDNATFAGASYLYGVRAKNARGNSELSCEAIGWRQVRQATTTEQVANDYDGDKLADVVLFNPDNGQLRILFTTLGEYPVAFGDATCVPVQGDYDGDGLADPMIYSATYGYWRMMLSLSGYMPFQATFGGPGQTAAVADFDNDRVTDPATYEAATGTLRGFLSASGYMPVQTQIGGPEYVWAGADYDGDGKADPAVYSASDGLLLVRLSATGYDEVSAPLGGAGMIVVPGDFDGDSKSEVTTYNEATGTLSAMLSSADYQQVDRALGGPGYTWIVPADYDGDGWLDPAAYSQTDGWTIMFSSLEYATVSDTFGGTNNVPFVP
ncbi:MAG: hypothetical protein NT011_10045 [Kiritimatiellaeota bacterium]|nr:hypothetical protein [Kiritimatiellota bacterium]